MTTRNSLKLPGRWLVAGMLTGCLCSPATMAAGPEEVQTLLEQGELQAALAAADAGLQGNENNIELSFLRGVTLTRLKRFDTAEQAFRSLIEKYPDLPEPYNNLAVIYAAQGQYEKARETLLQAINTHPSYATAYENIGDIYARMANDAYEQALQLDTASPAPNQNLALVSNLFSAARVGAGASVADRSPPQQEPATPPVEPMAQLPDPVAEQPDQTDNTGASASTESIPVSDAGSRPEAQPDPDEVIAAIHEWADAWSNQDVDAYLASYADEFLPASGRSRQAWAAERRGRVAGPEFIEVSINDIRVELVAPDFARARFNQDYRSNTYTDSVTKTLLMKHIDDRWLITEEYSS